MTGEHVRATGQLSTQWTGKIARELGTGKDAALCLRSEVGYRAPMVRTGRLAGGCYPEKTHEAGIYAVLIQSG